MKVLIFIASICITLSACQSKSDKALNNKGADTESQSKNTNAILLDLNAPVILDSSEVVLYPLINKRDKNNEGGSFSSSDRSLTYWNIIFYNTVTKKYHLLDDKKKMIINTYSPSYHTSGYNQSVQTVDIASFKSPQTDNFIFYSIIVKDQNNDGFLDNQDPDYLFISDKSGNSFKQISPDNVNVKSWNFIRKSGKLIMLTTKSKAQKDAIAVPYIYDLRTGQSPNQMFSAEFNQSVHQLHQMLWDGKK